MSIQIQENCYWDDNDNGMPEEEIPRLPYSPPKIEKYNALESPIYQQDNPNPNESNRGHNEKPASPQYPGRTYHCNQTWEEPHVQGYPQNASSDSSSEPHSNHQGNYQPNDNCTQRSNQKFTSSQNPRRTYHGNQTWQESHVQAYMQNASSDSSSEPHYYSYGPTMTVLPQPLPCYESYQSHQGSFPPPPHYVVSGQIITYPYGPNATSNSYYPSWAPPPKPIEYIRDFKSTDVLCGRGGATNSHPGNRSFREMVKRHQDQYLKAKKKDKPDVACSVVKLIRERGGRFLRRSHTTSQGEYLWVDIGDDRAREKTCQALREGAPELRKKRDSSSFSEDDENEESPKKKMTVSCDDADSKDRKSPKSKSSKSGNSFQVRPKSDYRDDAEDSFILRRMHNDSEQDPIIIEPCERLLGCQNVECTPLSKLSKEEQDLYLHYFLPPHPPIKKGSRRKKIIMANQAQSPISNHELRETWAV